MIDIIIPCYNSHKTIDRCLGSILMQTYTDYKVTLVNDGGRKYKEIIERYPIDIKEIGYDENHNPGYARNCGINNTSEDYIMFIDSDDVFYNPFVFSTLLGNMKENISVLAGNIIAENPNGTSRTLKRNRNFLHGKIYKRSFLDKYGIRFNDSGCCEDGSFNLLCSCVMDGVNETMVSLNYDTYGWLYNRDSLGRKDVDEWEHCKVPIGMTDNNIWAFKWLEEKGIDSKKILLEKVVVIMHLLIQYMSNAIHFPQYEDSNRDCVARYYREIYKPVEKDVTDEMFSSVYDLYKVQGEKEKNLKLLKNKLKSFN